MMRDVLPCRNLLLVEDDPDLREGLEERLAELGFQVQAEPNGRAALERLRAAFPAEVIVLDLMMPVMTGWEFRVEQRRDPLLSRIPVVVLTANGTPQAMAIDADARLTKPFRLQQLLQAIEQAVDAKLRERAAEQQAHAERLVSLGSLTAGLLHEIGNPLAAVLSNAELMQDQVEHNWPGCRSELQEQLRDLRSAAELAVGIVRDAVALSRFKESEEVMDVREVLEGALGVVRASLKERAEHVAEHAPSLPVRARRSRLLQVFVNLLLNALQALDPARRGRITTRLREDAEQKLVIVEIEDDGRGIPAHALDHIFEPFFTTKETRGTGLGLSTCRRIVLDLGGRISVDSAFGRGTTFRIELPAVGSSSS